MPRPKITPDELRDHRVSVYFNPAELSELRRRAKIAQLRLPAYLREQALVKPGAEPRRLGADEFRQIVRIGNNLNQVARAFNRNRPAPVFTRTDIERLEALISLLLSEEEN